MTRSGAIRTPVYLDHHATTPCAERVLAAMDRVYREHFGNPASSGHAFGWSAAALVEQAREQVAALVGAQPREVVFTSGATEADNLAVLGLAGACAEPGHLVCAAFEHEAVLEPMALLEARGWEVTRVPCNREGIVAAEAVAEALRQDTRLVAVMAAQNEIGTIQPFAAIGEMCRQRGVTYLSDAVQAVGLVDVDMHRDAIDLLTLSGHKIYGPKGVGALIVRAGRPRLNLAPRQLGGGQERGLRAGTLNVPGIVGLGEACVLARELRASEAVRLRALRDELWRHLQAGLEGVILNGTLESRLPHNLNVSFAGLQAHSLLGRLRRVAASTGSACSTDSTAPSAVLLGMGVPEGLARASLRLSLGRSTTAEEIRFAAGEIIRVVADLQKA